ncbi:MAG TPA: TetR/AcrR family transcriptional regulator [Eoetvoesiella sp.]
MKEKNSHAEGAVIGKDEPMGTRARILRAAEALFAEHGIDAVSLREITVAAQVNIAAIHYHFGSKEAVLHEIFTSKAKPIAELRLRLLNEVRKDKDGRPILEDILRAFLKPAFDVPNEGSHKAAFSLLRARLAFEPKEVRKAVLGKAFDESGNEYLSALRLALPELQEEHLLWRFHFVLGAMVYSMASPGRLESMTNGAFDTTDNEVALEELVAFAAAGFRA